MENQQSQARPYKVETDKPVRTYEVQPNGDVIMTEQIKSKVWFANREFLSYLRDHIKAKEDRERFLSIDTQDRVTKEIKDFDSDIAIIKPFMDESDKLAKIEFERVRIQNMTKAVVDELKKNPINKDWFAAAWANFKEEDKLNVIQALSDEDRNKLVKLKLDDKRKGK